MRRSGIVGLVIILFVSCGGKKQVKSYLEHKGYAAGTDYIIEYEGNSGNLNAEINQLLVELDRSVVNSNPSSIISKLNTADSVVTANSHIVSLFGLSSRIYRETGGAFDPTIQPVADWWGKDVRKFVFPQLVDSVTIDSLKNLTGFDDLYNSGSTIARKRSNVQLSFRSIYEGYMADQLAELFTRYNVINYRIEVGGKIRTKGNDPMGKPWQAGLDEPVNDPKIRQLLAIAPLNGNGFAIAGSYRDFYTKGEMKLPFTIDPLTVSPVKHTLISAAVFAPSAAEAQAYAHAFMVMGEEKTKIFLQSHPKLEVYLISTNYKGEWITYMSKGLNEKVEFVKDIPK